MSDENRWSAFPEKHKEQKPEKDKKQKKFFNIKLKSFILIVVNLLLIGIYLYTYQDLNILEKIIYGFSALEIPVLFELLVLLVFIVLTLVGLVVWVYFFLKDAIFPSDKKRERYFLHSWYEVKLDVDIVVIIALLIRLIIQPFSVFGSSMEPNFHDHEYIIVNSINYRLNKPSRGDAIVFKYPRNKNKNYIKRIIGLPGDRVVIKNNQVLIYNSNYPNGIELKEDYLSSTANTIPRNKDYSDVTLEENQYYVIGDNRDASSDSREWGLLDKNLMLGKAWVICWPLSDWKIIKTPTYNLEPSSLVPNLAFNFG